MLRTVRNNGNTLRAGDVEVGTVNPACRTFRAEQELPPASIGSAPYDGEHFAPGDDSKDSIARTRRDAAMVPFEWVGGAACATAGTDHTITGTTISRSNARVPVFE